MRRTRAEQVKLYNRYIQGLSGLPAALPGHSAHEYGFAFDVVLTPYDALADLGRVWIDAGGVWSTRDPVHFEYPGFPQFLSAFLSFKPETEGFFDTAAQFLIGTFGGLAGIGVVELGGWLQKNYPESLPHDLGSLVDWFTRL